MHAVGLVDSSPQDYRRLRLSLDLCMGCTDPVIYICG